MSSKRVQAVALAGCLIACARADWTATGPYGGEAEVVRTVPRQAGLVVAATRNGLFYRSVDGGASWVNQYFPAQLCGILHTLEVDPRYPGVWYAGMETDDGRLSGVYRTKDGGETWTQLPALRGKAAWSIAIWPAGPDMVAAGTSEGVFLSKDAGETWAAISPASDPELRPVVSLAFHPTTSSIIYAGTPHLPWRTRDGGAHWQSIHSGMLDDSDVFSITVEARSPATVFASACSGVYRSGDGGSSWRRLATPRGAFRAYLVTLDPQHSGVVFAATSAGLLRSADGGVAWSRVTQHAVKSIAFDPADANKIYFASATGGMLVSRDGGNSVAESNAGFSNRNFSAVAGSGAVLYASTVYEPGSGGIFRTSDQGRSWSRMSSPATGENILLLAAAPDDPDRLYAAAYRNLYRSTDGARTWVKQPTPPGGARITALLPLAGKSLLLGTASGLFRQTGGVWKAIPFPGGGRPLELLQRSGDGAVAALTAGGAFRSENGGASWTACAQPVAGAIWYGLTLDPGAGAALAATSRGLFRSTDRCASWQPVGGGLDQGTVSAVFFHPRNAGEAVAAHFGKLFHTTDGGLSWRPLGDQGRNGAYPSALLVLPQAPQRLFALFPRRGILSTSISLNRANSSTGGN